MPPRGFTPRQSGQAKLMRPRTSPGFLSRRWAGHTSVQGALNPEDRAIPEEDEGECEEEQIELLEYEWPDLPPIPCMKDAVSRKRVSQGISYLLPVDKGKNSINNCFRTDLRAMFQEPYASDNLQYDDNRVKLSAEVHFLSNTANTKWTNSHLNSIQTNLNADSEKARKLYVHSAPTGGVASRRMGIDPNKLRKRSNLFLPVKASKAQVSPEIVKLREEASQIIKQGLAFDDEGNELSQTGKSKQVDANGAKHSNGNTLHNNNGESMMNSTSSFTNSYPNQFHHHDHNNHTINTKNKDSKDSKNQNSNNNNNNPKRLTKGGEGHLLMTFGGSCLQDSMGTSVLNDKLQNLNIQQERFSNYEDLRDASPPKPLIPKEFSSPFLDPNDNQRIWEWLHYGESMNEFEYFLSVCG